MELPDIIYQKSDAVASISLNRPETRNAFTLPMLDSLTTALSDAQRDERIRVIVLSGQGNAFCSGGNIKDMASGKLTSWDMKRFLWEHVQRIPLLMEDLDKPVIGAIDGPAHGGGFDLAMACDLRVATDRATFCAAYVRIGLAPGNGSAYYLTRCLGVSRALDLLLTGRVMEMREALDLGLVQKTVQPENFQEEINAYAAQMTRWPLQSLKAVKRAVRNGLCSDLRSHLDYMSSQLALLSQTPEHMEAIRKLTQEK
ncbi:MAG: enoyl-CoA hydratase/isomerase family protein [Desulfatiglandaceae bacterium]|jgi:enoyl-CoA hydratase/carnithine racemase